MDKRSRQPRPPEARIDVGHVRLKVADLDRALAFYQDVLGFEITHRWGTGGVLLSGDGQHPHIELSADSQGAGPPAGGPGRFALRVGGRAALGQVLQRLAGAGIPLEAAVDRSRSEAIYVRDPDGNAVELYYDRPRPAWEHETVEASRPLDVDTLKAAAGAPEPAAAAPAVPISETIRERLRAVRLRLLDLHKVLLEDTKAAYELDRGRIASNATLLQLVINDPWFAWLHPLSELVVRIDETLQPDAHATDADGALLLEQIERLLSPAQSVKPFAERYYEALQRQPAVIMAHADVRRILKQPK